jgi:hypothetical protein
MIVVRGLDGPGWAANGLIPLERFAAGEIPVRRVGEQHTPSGISGAWWFAPVAKHETRLVLYSGQLGEDGEVGVPDQTEASIYDVGEAGDVLAMLRSLDEWEGRPARLADVEDSGLAHQPSLSIEDVGDGGTDDIEPCDWVAMRARETGNGR